MTGAPLARHPAAAPFSLPSAGALEVNLQALGAISKQYIECVGRGLPAAPRAGAALSAAAVCTGMRSPGWGRGWTRCGGGGEG